MLTLALCLNRPVWTSVLLAAPRKTETPQPHSVLQPNPGSQGKYLPLSWGRSGVATFPPCHPKKEAIYPSSGLSDFEDRIRAPSF